MFAWVSISEIDTYETWNISLQLLLLVNIKHYAISMQHQKKPVPDLKSAKQMLSKILIPFLKIYHSKLLKVIKVAKSWAVYKCNKLLLIKVEFLLPKLVTYQQQGFYMLITPLDRGGGLNIV